MPARTRSNRRRNRGRTVVSVPLPTRPQQRQDTTSGTTSETSIQQRPKAAEPDYSYVFRDLKYFAMVAGGIVAIFIILRFTLFR